MTKEDKKSTCITVVLKMVEETKFLCMRCKVDLVKLDVIDVNGDLDNPRDAFEIMVYGGSRRYDLYECPRCGELSFFRRLTG